MGSIAALSTSRRTGPEVLSTSVEGGTRSFSVAIGIAPKDKHAPTLLGPANQLCPEQENAEIWRVGGPPPPSALPVLNVRCRERDQAGRGRKQSFDGTT